MSPLVIWFLLLTVHLLNRYGEFRIHKSNYEFLVFAGGEEIQAKAMKLFYALGLLIIPMSLVEYMLVGRNLQTSTSLQIMSISLFGASLFLRYWTIESLGARWTMRCIFVNAYPKTKRGPYKFMNHPEYLARYFDIIAVGVFLGSFVSILLVSIPFFVVIALITVKESQQIKELAEPDYLIKKGIKVKAC